MCERCLATMFCYISLTLNKTRVSWSNHLSALSLKIPGTIQAISVWKTTNPWYSPRCCCNKHDTVGPCSGGIHTQWSQIVHILNQYSCHLDMCLILHCMSHCLAWTPLEDNVHSYQFDMSKKSTLLQKGLWTTTLSMIRLGVWLLPRMEC